METIRACQSGVRQPGEDPLSKADNPLFHMTGDPKADPGAPGAAPKPPGLENFTHEQILQMYTEMKEGKTPELLKRAQAGQYTDAEGNPIIDAEGGATI